MEKEKIDIEVVDRRLLLQGRRPVPSPELSAAAMGHAATPPEAATGSKLAGTSDRGGGEEPEAEPANRRIRLHLMEIDHGAFRREVELPADADREGITANHRNGLLWIEIPKKETAR